MAQQGWEVTPPPPGPTVPSTAAQPVQYPAHNITRRVTFRAGWIGALSGESQGRAVERCLAEMNAQGYRVVFMVTDRWNIFRTLLWLLILIVTLGFVGRRPSLLIVGEPIHYQR